MKVTKKLIVFGDSIGIIIDQPICRKLDLKKDDLIEVELKKVK